MLPKKLLDVAITSALAQQLHRHALHAGRIAHRPREGLHFAVVLGIARRITQVNFTIVGGHIVIGHRDHVARRAGSHVPRPVVVGVGRVNFERVIALTKGVKVENLLTAEDVAITTPLSLIWSRC